MPQGPGPGPQRQAPRVHYLLSYRAGAGDSISGLHKIWAVKPGKIYKNGALRREGAAPPLRGRKAGNCATARQGAAAPSQARLSALICNAPPGAETAPGGAFLFYTGRPQAVRATESPKAGPWRTCPAATENVARKGILPPKTAAAGPRASRRGKQSFFCTRGKTKAGAFLGCGLSLSGADARQSRRTPVQNRWQ